VAVVEAEAADKPYPHSPSFRPGSWSSAAAAEEVEAAAVAGAGKASSKRQPTRLGKFEFWGSSRRPLRQPWPKQ